MDLKRLKHFIALAEEGRFSQAAQRVHLSQAAFSRSIQALEGQLDLRLFDRGAEGAHLTPAGVAVLQQARALVQQARCLQSDIALIRSGDAGEITIGAAPLPAGVILPDLLSQLNSLCPQLRVKVRMGNLPKLLEQMDALEIDFCMGDPRLVAADPRHATVALGRHPGGLYCRRGHPLARRGRVDRPALLRHGVATISMSPALETMVARAYGFDSSAEFPQLVECDDVHTLVRLIGGSDLLGLLPHTLVAQDSRQLRQLRMEGAEDLEADIQAIWLKSRTLAPAAWRAVQLAQDISAGLIRAAQR